MKKAFIDTDVILDLLAEREPFSGPAQHLFRLIDQKEVDGYASSLSFSNLYYILRKLRSGREAVQILKKLKLIVNVLPVDGKTVESALASGFRDFEDALQYYTAVENHIRFFVTRNTKDYQKASLVVCTAEEYLNIRGLKNL